jgi:single-strand DNA-binding protein
MQVMTIAGKLGRDAETRQTQAGDSVTSFTVAVDQRNGRDKTTNWYRCSLWGKRGQALASYLLKGASVTVSGEFSVSEYDGKTQLNIRANDIALQGGRTPDGSRGHAQNDALAGPVDDLDSDIPFMTNVSIW